MPPCAYGLAEAYPATASTLFPYFRQFPQNLGTLIVANGRRRKPGSAAQMGDPSIRFEPCRRNSQTRQPTPFLGFPDGQLASSDASQPTIRLSRPLHSMRYTHKVDSRADRAIARSVTGIGSTPKARCICQVKPFYSCFMTPEFGHSPAGPGLLVRTPDAERLLSAGRSYFIGRDPQSDIVVNDSRVSWRHAVLRVDGSNWLLEDAGSTNGTFEGSNRIQRLAISSSCAVNLGHPSDGPSLSCVVSVPVQPRPPEPAVPAGPVPTRYAHAPGGAAAASPPANPAVQRVRDGGYAGPGGQGGYGPGGQGPVAPVSRLSMERQPSAVLQLPSTLLRIGRAADNQVVVADLSVSRYHAELRREPRSGYAIVDLGSHNGTFVNGQRVGSAPVTERDLLSIYQQVL